MEKSQYHCRKNLWKLPLSLHTFYELLFPEFIATDSDGEVILTKFFKHHKVMRNLDLSEYYDSEYTETKSSSSETDSSDPETETEDENVFSNNMPPLMIMGVDTPNDFISSFQDYLRQPGNVNNSVLGLLINSQDLPIPWFTNTINTSLERT
jgi:hypothetical protein